MKIVFTAALACSVAALTPALLSAQGTDRSSIFLELGGNGLVYSINYEIRFLDQFSGRAGFGFFNVSVYEPDRGVDQAVGVALMPLMINTFIGRGTHQLEVGLGPLLSLAGTGVDRVERGSAYVEVDDLSIAGYTSALGYRYQRRGGGLLLRAMLTPFYSGEAQLWGGVSLGLSY
jgi:hypothetical protein